MCKGGRGVLIFRMENICDLTLLFIRKICRHSVELIMVSSWQRPKYLTYFRKSRNIAFQLVSRGIIPRQRIFLCVYCLVQVLQCIPDNWSLGIIHQFLMSSVRKTLNRSRTTRVERMLLRGNNLAMRLQTLLLTKDPFYMTEDRHVASAVVAIIL